MIRDHWKPRTLLQTKIILIAVWVIVLGQETEVLTARQVEAIDSFWVEISFFSTHNKLKGSSFLWADPHKKWAQNQTAWHGKSGQIKVALALPQKAKKVPFGNFHSDKLELCQALLHWLHNLYSRIGFITYTAALATMGVKSAELWQWWVAMLTPR